MRRWQQLSEPSEFRPRFDRREYESLKNQVELVVESLKRFKIDKDAKDYKSLLENLMIVLRSENITNKNISRKLDFTNEIQYFSQFISIDIRLYLSRDDNKMQAEIYEIQSSLFKNILLMLEMNCSTKNDLYCKVLETFLDDLIFLRQLLCDMDENEHKLIVQNVVSNSLTVLKCLSVIASNYDFKIQDISKNSLCSKYLSIVRCYSFYGLESYDFKAMNLHLYPSMIGQVGQEPEFNQRKRKQERKQTEDDEDDSLFALNSSISNYSATEYSSSELEDDLQLMHFAKNKKVYADIRVHCYELLSSSIQIFGIRIVFGFWSFLFPEKFEASSQSKQFTVLWTILKDNSNRVKKEALSFMYDFFYYGKFFIKALVSETRNNPSSKSHRSQASFTTISQSLTLMIKELHIFFDRILVLESKSASLIMLYKVMTLIISITPYNKISSDILHPLFDRNSYFLDHKVTQIKNLSLVLYVKMFTPELLSKEFRTWLTESTTGPEVMNKIFKNCFEFIRNSDHMLLSSESIKLLSSIVKHHGAMIDLFNANLIKFQVLKSLQQISIEMLNSERFYQNSVLQCLVCKFVYTFGMFLKHIPNKNLDKIFLDDDGKIDFITKWFLEVIESKTFHIALIQPDMTKAQNSSQVSLINSISLVPDEVFRKMPQNVQYRIVSLLMSLADISGEEYSEKMEQDGENISSDTRSAAIRCLSILQGLSPLCCDSNMIADIVQVCLDVLDKNSQSTQKTKKKTIFLLEHTLWPLANVLDGVKKRHLEDEIELSLLKKILIALNRSYDVKNLNYHTDDILVNLARCSALVVYIVLVKKDNETHKENHDEGVDLEIRRKNIKIEKRLLLNSVKNMIDLLSSSKLFKLQWNICISFSYLLELRNFVLLCKSSSSLSSPEEKTLLDKIFYAILKLFKSSENHKVQSYAIFAICSICDLSFFDDKFADLWPLIVDMFFNDYDCVPTHSKQSWIDKYCFSLERVIKHFILNQKSTNIEEEKIENLTKLKLFLQQQNIDNECEDLKNLQNLLNVLC